MTNKTLEDKIINLEQKLESLRVSFGSASGRLEKQIKELKVEKEKALFPQINDIYYTLNTDGSARQNIFAKDFYNLGVQSIGNIFQTKEEALQYSDFLKAVEKLKKTIKDVNDGWKPDWTDAVQEKCLINYSKEDGFGYSAWGQRRHKEDCFYIKSAQCVNFIIKSIPAETLYLALTGEHYYD